MLKNYIATFEAPLPQDTIVALSQLFELDYQLTSQVGDALAEIGGHCTSDSQGSEEVGTLNTYVPTSPQTSNAAPGALVVAT